MLFLDPDCLPGGRQGGVGNFAFVANSQCYNQYYTCDANLRRTLSTCHRNLQGSFFGLGSNNAWQCLVGNPSTACGSGKIDFIYFLCDSLLF